MISVVIFIFASKEGILLQLKFLGWALQRPDVPPAKYIQHLKPGRGITNSTSTRSSTCPTFYFSFFEMHFNGKGNVLTVQCLYWYSYSVPVQSTIFFLCFGTKYKKQRIMFFVLHLLSATESVFTNKKWVTKLIICLDLFLSALLPVDSSLLITSYQIGVGLQLIQTYKPILFPTLSSVKSNYFLWSLGQRALESP